MARFLRRYGVTPKNGQDATLRILLGGVGGTTHATSGDLVGQGATIAGDATNFTPHATSGAVSGQGSTVSGSAAHIAIHGTSGAIEGPGAVIAGDAARVGAAVTHETTGAISGPGAVISGTAQNGTVSDATGGYWPTWPRLKTRKEREEEEQAKEELLAEVIAVPVPNKKATRQITMEQLIGKTAAAEMSLIDLEAEVMAIKQKKRRREQQEMMLMY